MTHARTDYNVVLDDGTELWVNWSPTPQRTRPRITEITPTESLVLKALESLKKLKGAPLIDLSKVAQDDLELIHLCAGDGKLNRVPQFRPGEIVSLVYINPENSKRAVFSTLQTVSAIRA